ICYIQVAGRVHRNSKRVTQLTTRSRSVVATEAGRTVPCHSRNDAIGHLTNALIVCVRNVKITGGVYGNPSRVIQLSASGQAVIADGAGRTAPCHGGDDAARDFSDPLVGSVRDVQLTSQVHGDCISRSQRSAAGG